MSSSRQNRHGRRGNNVNGMDVGEHERQASGDHEYALMHARACRETLRDYLLSLLAQDSLPWGVLVNPTPQGVHVAPVDSMKGIPKEMIPNLDGIWTLNADEIAEIEKTFKIVWVFMFIGDEVIPVGFLFSDKPPMRKTDINFLFPQTVPAQSE